MIYSLIKLLQFGFGNLRSQLCIWVPLCTLKYSCFFKLFFFFNINHRWRNMFSWLYRHRKSAFLILCKMLSDSILFNFPRTFYWCFYSLHVVLHDFKDRQLIDLYCSSFICAYKVKIWTDCIDIEFWVSIINYFIFKMR